MVSCNSLVGLFALIVHLSVSTSHAAPLALDTVIARPLLTRQTQVGPSDQSEANAQAALNANAGPGSIPSLGEGRLRALSTRQTQAGTNSDQSEANAQAALNANAGPGSIPSLGEGRLRAL
ncbi:hypothetical protein BD410DRAFT_842025 [Rickenella mellea]|uniref:Uncharacterized protein n=1 Tax=Rickenella mellea TaxID=50990 RepID=A0A4Y7PWH8_9AGAM|nr:hypothetical protein BD410DRAFT_842025 [Rickenella mellea]